MPLSTRWMRESKDKNIVDHHATEATRGTESSRWPIEMILKRGFAVATAYYGDIEPDHADGWKEGLRAAVSKVDATSVTFLMPNAKEVVYPLVKLSEDSRTALAVATQPKK